MIAQRLDVFHRRCLRRLQSPASHGATMSQMKRRWGEQAWSDFNIVSTMRRTMARNTLLLHSEITAHSGPLFRTYEPSDYRTFVTESCLGLGLGISC